MDSDDIRRSHPRVIQFIEAVLRAQGPLDEWINGTLFGIEGPDKYEQFEQPEIWLNRVRLSFESGSDFNFDQTIDGVPEAKTFAEFFPNRRPSLNGILIEDRHLEDDAPRVDISVPEFINIIAVHELLHQRMHQHCSYTRLGVKADDQKWLYWNDLGLSEDEKRPIREAHEELALLAVASFPWGKLNPQNAPSALTLKTYLDKVTEKFPYQTFADGDNLMNAVRNELLERFQRKHPMLFK